MDHRPIKSRGMPQVDLILSIISSELGYYTNIEAKVFQLLVSERAKNVKVVNIMAQKVFQDALLLHLVDVDKFQVSAEFLK